ncbi:MAG: septum formation initiator family protein [Syntrophales bacterium]
MKVGRYLVIFLLIMGFLIVFGDNGLIDNFVLKEKHSILRDANMQLVKENNKLKQEIALLKSNPKHIEATARNDLGMVKKGDIVYKFVN